MTNVSARSNLVNFSPEKNLTKNSNIADWFYFPSWKRVPLLKTGRIISGCYLVFVDECGIGSEIVQQLRHKQQDAIAVLISDEFKQIDCNTYSINPKNQDDYNILLQAIYKQGKTPKFIAHLWSVSNSLKQSIETIQY